MKKTDSRIFSFLALSFLVVPSAVSAQWSSGLSEAGGYGLPSGSIYGIISTILMWLLAIFGILGVIGFVVAGILYLTAFGNDKDMEKAKNAMTYSIIGIIVGLMGYVVIRAVDSALSGSSSYF